MGLDAVELVMDVEKRFTLRLPDAEAEGIVTVADLIGFVHGRLTRHSGLGCPTAVAFRRVRDATRETTGRVDARFRPGESIETRLRPRQRRRLWRILFPPLQGGHQAKLQRSPRVLIAFACLLAPAWLAGVAAAWLFGEWALVCFGPLVSAVATGPLLLLTRPLATHPPSDLRTFGDLARRIAELEGSGRPRPGATREEVSGEVREIVARWCGCPPAEVLPQHRLLQDLL